MWTGPRLPAVAWLTACSALERSGLKQVTIHHEDAELARCPLAVDLVARGAKLRLCDGDALLATLKLPAGDRTRLRQILARLQQPAARSNVIRAAILHAEGGVYLDTDAIVVRSLVSLLSLPGFAGLEHIALPVKTLDSGRPGPWIRAGALMGIRELLARAPGGERGFKWVAGAFSLSVNNAVLGACPGHPTLDAVLRTAAILPDATAMARYRLGTKLLETITDNRSTADFVLYPPEAFYPFGPEMSWHLFRRRDAVDLAVDLPAATCVVHLYDSVLRRRTGDTLDAAWLLRHRDDTIVGALCAPWIDALAALTAAEHI